MASLYKINQKNKEMEIKREAEKQLSENLGNVNEHVIVNSQVEQAKTHKAEPETQINGLSSVMATALVPETLDAPDAETLPIENDQSKNRTTNPFIRQRKSSFTINRGRSRRDESVQTVPDDSDDSTCAGEVKVSAPRLTKGPTTRSRARSKLVMQTSSPYCSSDTREVSVSPVSVRSGGFQLPTVELSRMKVTSSEASDDSHIVADSTSRVSQTPLKQRTLKQLREELPKFNLANVESFLTSKLEELEYRQTVIEQSLQEISREKEKAAVHLGFTKDIKKRLQKSSVNRIFARKTDDITQKAFEWRDYMVECGDIETLATRNDKISKLLKNMNLVFAENEIQKWKTGNVLHEFEQLNTTNLSNVVSIFGFMWQIVLRVKVQDQNIALSVCLLCLGPELRSQSNTSYHLECTGKVDIKFQIPSVLKEASETFRYTDLLKMKFAGRPFAKEILVTSLNTFRDNFDITSCHSSWSKIACNISMREPQPIVN